VTLASQEQLIPFVLATQSIYAAAGFWLLFDALMPALVDLAVALFLDHCYFLPVPYVLWPFVICVFFSLPLLHHSYVLYLYRG
jgi:hypothetical protein